MQGTRLLLETLLERDLVAGSLRGLFHIAIGRRITDSQGKVLAEGVTWRVLAALLKELKYDRELVREIGADPDTLSPKDREKFWYAAITLANVDGHEAHQQAEVLANELRRLGWIVGPPPGLPSKPRTSGTPQSENEREEPQPKSPPEKKRKKS